MRKCLFIICCLMLLGLTACQSSLWNRYPPPTPTRAGAVMGATSGAVIGAAAGGGAGAGVGLIMGGVFGSCLGNILGCHYDIIEKLQYNGVQVIRVGDQIKLILPSDRFFMPHSSNLNIQYYPILNIVSDFLCKFEKISIEIAAYTDDCDSWQRNLALSRAQAEHIMTYLWRSGVDTRLIYARGFGDSFPIANNFSKRGSTFNRRIEISLTKISD